MHGTEKEFYQCFLDKDNDGFYEYSYMIDLPDNFMDDNRDCIGSGDFFLNIPGAEALDDNANVSQAPPSVYQ